MERSSGILLPIFSLPSKYGIGDLGENAYKFVDILSKARQKYWQVLPINPIEESNSPYYSTSSFAGNPLFISPYELYKKGYLKSDDLCEIETASSHIDYKKVKDFKKGLLLKAYDEFSKNKKNLNLLKSFFTKDLKPLYDYALFQSIKDVYNGAPFTTWDIELKNHNDDALSKFEKANIDKINFHLFLQYLFFTSWQDLKNYANKKGIKIIGDAPIYSALDSADVWANSKNFHLDENMNPIEIAGCPPDGFNSEGQLWGNPVYDIDYMKNNKFDYMLSKMKHLSNLYDCIRIDHFRGYESFFAIKNGEENAKNGKWIKSFGREFFDILNAKLPHTQFIAEDLGFITDEVIDLLKYTGFPGMKVAQFAFDHNAWGNDIYLPHHFEKNTVAYLGTHDNDTFLGWFSNLDEIDKKFASDYFRLNTNVKPNISALKVLYHSNANLVIATPQDLLGFDGKARINTPGTVGDENWSYIFNEEDLFSEMVIEELTKLTIGTRR